MSALRLSGSFTGSCFLFTRRNLFSYYTILPCGISSLPIPACYVSLSLCFLTSLASPPPVVFLRAGGAKRVSFQACAHNTQWMKCRLRCDSSIKNTHTQARGHTCDSRSPVINPLHTRIHPVIKALRPTLSCGPCVPTIRASAGLQAH